MSGRRAPALVAALAAATLMANAPAASADEPVFSCGYDSVQRQEVTGPVYEGVIHGYVLHAGGGPAGIRCFVTVNGVEVDDTEYAVVGERAGLAAGHVTFVASDTDLVQLWAEVTTSHGTFRHGYERTYIRIPPDTHTDIFGTLEQVWPIVDPVVCAVTRDIGGRGFNVLGQVVIDPQGNVYVAGEPFWYCTYGPVPRG